MKKILIISAVFPPESVTSAFLNYDLAKALSRDYDVTVIRPKPTRPYGAVFQEGLFHDPDFRVIQVDSYTYPKSELVGRFKEAISFSREAVKYIKRNHDQIDFVYNDGWQLFGLYIIAKACVRYDIPYMVPIQDIYPECLLTKKRYPGIIKKLLSSFLLPFDVFYQKHATSIRTISEEMADYLSSTRAIRRDAYLVVNNWQNDEDFRDLPEPPHKGSVTFGYVGSINVHSNVDLMIRAFATANVPDAEFLIYGGGDEKERCLKLVEEQGLINVRFGFVHRDEIPKIQAEADVLVLALPKGNGNLCLPSKLTSYLLSGKPVLASVDLDSSTKRILEGFHCGIVVPPDDERALADAFIRLSRMDEKARHAMGKNSREYALRHLTRSVNLGIVANKIRDILS